MVVAREKKTERTVVSEEKINLIWKLEWLQTSKLGNFAGENYWILKDKSITAPVQLISSVPSIYYRMRLKDMKLQATINIYNRRSNGILRPLCEI